MGLLYLFRSLLRTRRVLIFLGLGLMGPKETKYGALIHDVSRLQPADIGWPTGYGKKISNSQACCLAQLCLVAA